MVLSETDFTKLIKQLMDPGCYPHPTGVISIEETHISWVILTGDYVYKIKKPVNFGFLDFSSEERRHHFCEEEVRLNRRLAPEIYLGVVPVCGSVDSPVVGDSDPKNGPVLTHAVRMRQFPSGLLLKDLASAGPLDEEVIRSLSTTIADFHLGTWKAPADSKYGTPEAVAGPIFGNFRQIRTMKGIGRYAGTLQPLESWAKDFIDSRTDTLRLRLHDGFIRDCHGDLHINNIIYWKNRAVAFDCLEFNPELRIIDVMSEVAFLLMDLIDHRNEEQGFEFLNQYLVRTGDYEGCELLPLYLSYRAMVRAKVASIQLAQHSEEPEKAAQLEEEFGEYLRLASRFAHESRSGITITFGISGSGKSTMAREYTRECRGIHLRSDVERKRLFGLGLLESSTEDQKEKMYHPDTTARIYDRLLDLSERITRAGFPVIVDATFLKKADRDRFRELSESLQIPFRILNCNVSAEQAEAWLEKRASEGGDPSEATVEVMRHQLRTMDPLTREESRFTAPVRHRGME